MKKKNRTHLIRCFIICDRNVMKYDYIILQRHQYCIYIYIHTII